MNVWGSTTSGLFLAPVVAVGGRTGAAEGGRTGPVNHTAEICPERRALAPVPDDAKEAL